MYRNKISIELFKNNATIKFKLGVHHRSRVCKTQSLCLIIFSNPFNSFRKKLKITTLTITKMY